MKIQSIILESSSGSKNFLSQFAPLTRWRKEQLEGMREEEEEKEESV